MPKKPKSTEHKETDMRKLRAEAYNNTAWKKMRETYLKSHPICEECLKKGKITPATSVHHIKSPFKKGEVNYALLLNYENLESVCHECHGLLHASEQGHKTNEQILEDLDNLFKKCIDNDDE